MSTHAYAAEDYGMLLDRPALITLACKEFNMTPEQIEEKGIYGVLWDYCEKEGFAHLSNFSGEALFLDDLGNDGEAIGSYEYDTVYYIPVLRYPKLIGVTAPYASFDILVKEFRDKLADKLPDYDIRGNICHIIGCCNG